MTYNKIQPYIERGRTMAFFDKLGGLAKTIGDKTADAIEINKLSSRINSEKAAAGEEMKKIGEFYYGSFAVG